MAKDLWIGMGVAVAMLCGGMSMLFVRAYILKHRRQQPGSRIALCIAIVMMGPCLNSTFAVISTIMYSPCLNEQFISLRLLGTIMLTVLIAVGSFGLFFLNGD